ncbi:MAG: hypothetical protein C0502_11595, partial [Opitutus sp.]|nr:hypothetical protein [Opitutus sp.]
CAIADGIMPGNADRNYVIRRILRRGIMYGRKNLGLKTGFFEQLVAPVVESLGDVFPELKTQRVMIERAIRAEEESFGKTLDRGLAVFTDEVAKLSSTLRSNLSPGSARVPRAASGVSPDAPQNIRYSKRRLPHFERPWGKYHLAFSTHERRPLAPEARQLVLDAILHGHREGRYHLYAAAVLPDHVHLLLEPQPKSGAPAAQTEFHSLTEILHSLKSFTAHAINKASGASGSVWEKESFDRLIRSESDLVEKFNYIADNPRNSGLADVDGAYPFVWLGEPEAARRDAGQSPRDAGAPQIVPGHIAFLLYDTYGFPLDMTQLLAAERGLTVDVAGFEAEMEKQRERARAARKTEVILGATEGAAAVAATKFEGYSIDPTTTFHAHVTDVVKTEKDTFLVFDTTPFYAEMGGQVGDSGHALIGGHKVDLVDCIRDKSGRHLHKLVPALNSQPSTLNFAAGTAATLHVDYARRRAISRHHSAAHLVHWALRKILGTHVRQFGTHKTPDRLRFDFTHFEALTAAQIKECEQLINEKVIDNAKVE